MAEVKFGFSEVRKWRLIARIGCATLLVVPLLGGAVLSAFPFLWAHLTCPADQRLETKEKIVQHLAAYWRYKTNIDDRYFKFRDIVSAEEFSDPNSISYEIKFDRHTATWQVDYFRNELGINYHIGGTYNTCGGAVDGSVFTTAHHGN